MRTWPRWLGPVLVAVACREESPRRPNILFIAVDDLRPAIGAYGDSLAITPNIDRLARSGVTFLQAHVQQAVCNPSRASIMTGLRPDSLRVWDLDTHFRTTVPDVVTLPQYFRRHGYFATVVGKVYHNILPDTLSWSEPEQKIAGFPYDPDAVYLHPDNLAIQATRKAAAMAAGNERRHVDPFGMWYLKANATEAVDVPDSAYYDGAQTNYAVRALRALAARREPFFFGVGYYRPHLPYNAPQKYWDLYDRASIPLASGAAVPSGAPEMAINNMRELRGYADFATVPHPLRGSVAEADARRLKHGYYASVSYVDAQVGRLLDALDSLGIAEHTIVVLWGDHGYKLGEHNSWAKMTNHLVDTRAPLIIRAPGRVVAGTRLPQMVELVDLYPTLTELAGLGVPDHLQGTSAVPLFAEPTRGWKTATFSQFLRHGIWVGLDSQPYMGYSMRTERYRYATWEHWVSKQRVARELYDHQADPGEGRNLADDPALQGVLDSLEVRRGAGWRAARPSR